MVNQAYINDIDIATWGASLVKGAYEALLKPASTKENVQNRSRSKDGIREDTSNVKLNDRVVSISFWITGVSINDYLAKYENFLNEVTSGLVLLRVPILKKSYKLIYQDCSSYGHYNLTKGKITLKFREPNPADRETL